MPEIFHVYEVERELNMVEVHNPDFDETSPEEPRNGRTVLRERPFKTKGDNKWLISSDARNKARESFELLSAY